MNTKLRRIEQFPKIAVNMRKIFEIMFTARMMFPPPSNDKICGLIKHSVRVAFNVKLIIFLVQSLKRVPHQIVRKSVISSKR